MESVTIDGHQIAEAGGLCVDTDFTGYGED